MIYDEDETLGVHRSAMIRFVENLIQGNKIQIHDGANRSWLHINDAVILFEKLLNPSLFPLTLNIGHPINYRMCVLVQMICDELKLNYDNMVETLPLPEKMTLIKIPNLNLQDYYLKYTPKISLEEGIDRVIKKVKERLK